MKEITDKMITWFFVITLGIVWYCSKRYYVKQDQYAIIISDVFGKRIKTEEIRTEFKTHVIAHSFALEYQNILKEYKFSVTTDMPEFKRKWFWKIF